MCVGVGVPSVVAEENNCVTYVGPTDIPGVIEAKDMYQGQLTEHGYFGLDALSNRPELVLRRDQWLSVMNSQPHDIFTNIISSNGNLLKESINNCIVIIDQSTCYFDQ